MKNNQKTNVRMTMIASILFVLISIFLVMMFTYEGQVKEFIYKTNPNTVNLIKVSIYAVEHHDLEMIKKYVPLAIESDDFENIVNKNKLYISRNVQFKESAMKAEFTQ